MDDWGSSSVIAVSFDDDRNAYNALTRLGELASQGRVGLREASVVVRGDDGQVEEKDATQPAFMSSTVGGGLIGLLIGIIGGPLGVLIGGTSGLLVGSLFDISDEEETESALSALSSTVKVGRTALLAVVSEPSPEIIDAAMSGLGGTVLRRPLSELEAEIAASEQAQRKAAREARKELVRSHHEHDRAAVSARVEELKGKLHRGPKAPAADAPAPVGGAH